MQLPVAVEMLVLGVELVERPLTLTAEMVHKPLAELRIGAVAEVEEQDHLVQTLDQLVEMVEMEELLR